jgi:hypothetical protein
MSTLLDLNQLSREAFERARRFLMTEARVIDRALFVHRFENAPSENVIEALTHYRNDDGGFGHGLEPDLRTPNSSALATGHALEILAELGCSAEHPLVVGAVRYLLATFEENSGVWRVVPHDANDHPHAPWWHDEGGSLSRTFDGFLVIPRAQIVGLLHRFSAWVSADWLAALTERTVADIETIEPFGSGGGDDLKYALSLAETPTLSPHWRARLMRRIRAVLPAAVSRDPAAWDTYTITPLKVIASPKSPILDLVEDAVQRHLDYQIAHQSAAGTWDPVWTWGEFYPDHWETARHEWRGVLTLETLTVLRAFGRVAGIL